MAYTIAIDAGHGSNTAGKRTPAVSGYPSGYKEHWINVKCAYYAAKAAERCGLRVVKSAWDDTDFTDDPDVSIIDRQNLIRRSGATVSVSFHADASNSNDKFDSASGASTYVHSYANKREDSVAMAKHIQKYLPTGTAQKDRGVNYGNFGLCNALYMNVKAAALVEIAFMTNLHEAQLMMAEDFCREQAEDVIHGVCDYLGVTYTAKKGTSVEPSKKPSNEPTYTIGQTYTLLTELKVRKGPGTFYAAKTHNELTAAGKLYDKDNDGALDAGTRVTCQEVKKSSGYIWIRVPSGWIAAYNRNKEKAYIK